MNTPHLLLFLSKFFFQTQYNHSSFYVQVVNYHQNSEQVLHSFRGAEKTLKTLTQRAEALEGSARHLRTQTKPSEVWEGSVKAY